MSEKREYWENRLQWVVRALAQSGSAQVSLFTPLVCVPDELALEWEECLMGRRDEGLLFCEEFEFQLQRLDQLIDEMSGPENAELWTLDSLFSSAEWNSVRQQAREVARRFEWSTECPIENPQLYILSGSRGLA
jgi:hypothetical protein